VRLPSFWRRHFIEAFLNLGPKRLTGNRYKEVAMIRCILLLLALGFAGQSLAATVNVNTADAATLARDLKGIGLKRAQAIVDYRSQHGPFKSADELALVKGIGPAAIAKNRSVVTFETRSTPATQAPARKPTGSLAAVGVQRRVEP
jgi:competence protein ComEA